MGDSTSSDVGRKLNDSDLVSSIGKVMAVAIVMLCFVVIFVFFLHMFSRWFWSRRPVGAAINPTPTTRQHRLFDFAGGHQETAVATIHCQGLDPSVLKTLPIIVFSKKDFKDGIECAVCLSDVSEGENARILSKCNHGFHMECIDMWFQSHATCPLCRTPISGQSDKILNQESSTTTEGELRIPVEDNVRMFPTNVLLWGNESQISIFGPLADVNHCVSSQFPSASVTTSVSSSSASTVSADANRAEGMLAIDVPSQVNEDEVKSPATPRLRSFMRLLSMDSRRVNPSSTNNLDVEQGG
ncbi:hypothetical protein Leryth_018586 [Lithospermum erythrorhizon]|nr:hypothetical protein Leryth_018586 [Lithospermum erythrorhizon]